MTFDPKAYGAQMQKFASALKGAETTVTNAGNEIGRASLIALKAGALSQLSIANAAYAAFKPKSKAGKLCEPKARGERVESVSSLRNAKGGDAARKQLDALFSVADFMESDADTEGANIVHPAIAAYIEGNKGCAGGLRALDTLCKEAMRQHAANITGQDTEDEDEDANEDANDASDANAAPSLSEQVTALSERLIEASPQEREDAQDAIAAMVELISELTLEDAGPVAQAA